MAANTHTEGQVDKMFRTLLTLARKTVIDELEKAIKDTDNIKTKIELGEKLQDTMQGELRLFQARSEPIRRVPQTPVYIKGTNLSLKNLDRDHYVRFCHAISNKLGYKNDFSDSPFVHCSRQNRVYEAIKVLYNEHNLNQEELDEIVNSSSSKE